MEARKYKRYKFSGFTLVELIVVITILAILGTIAFISIKGFEGSARDSVRTSDISNMMTALELFQIKTGNYPIPVNPTVYTGGVSGGSIVSQGTLNGALIGFSVANPVDPLTKVSYVYSTLRDGAYYQIGGELEGSLSSNFKSPFMDSAFADSKTALVKGNYTLDPLLPSLIIIPNSVPTSAGSGGVFSPEACFVTNGSSSNLISVGSGSCVQKKNMILKSLDSSLVAYWDMESYYQTTYGVDSNVPFIKDLSGNNYDIYPRKTSGVVTATSNASGSIFTGTLTGKGIRFDNNNFNYQFGTLDYGYNASYNGRIVKHLDPDFGMNLYTSNSGGTLINGISFVSIVDYDASKGVAWSNKRVLSFGKGNNGLVDIGDVIKGIDSSPFRINNTQLGYINGLHSYITATNNGTLGVSYGTQGLKGCGGFCSTAFSTYKDTNVFNGLSQVVVNMNFQNKENCVYVNGYKKFCYPLLDETIQRLQEPGYKMAWFTISHTTENFVGIIDDIKIYNRALSDVEIRQQARAVGF